MHPSPRDASDGAGASAAQQPSLRQARTTFGSTIRTHREMRGYSQMRFAEMANYHASYVSKIECGQTRPSWAFAVRAEEILGTRGAILREWRIYRDAEFAEQSTNGQGTTPATACEQAVPTAPARADEGLLVLLDFAELVYSANHYHLTIKRQLANNGDGPINGYPVRIRVDRYPEDPQRANLLYRTNPLSWNDVGFRCWAGEDEQTELVCVPVMSADRVIEALVQFRSADLGIPLPLRPGRTMTLTYAYRVSDQQWGTWLQRHVKARTERLSVRLDFPAHGAPSFLWGTQTTLQRPEPEAFESEIQLRHNGGRSVWSWSVDNPWLEDRYRFEWRFNDS